MNRAESQLVNLLMVRLQGPLHQTISPRRNKAQSRWCWDRIKRASPIVFIGMITRIGTGIRRYATRGWRVRAGNEKLWCVESSHGVEAPVRGNHARVDRRPFGAGNGSARWLAGSSTSTECMRIQCMFPKFSGASSNWAAWWMFSGIMQKLL